MALITYNKSKIISSEISESNILNYKRRSKLVSKQYCQNTYKIILNTTETLKNCYNALYDLKNIITDYINTARKERRLFTISEKHNLDKIIDQSKSQITSAYVSYNNYIDKENTQSKKIQSRIEKKISKDIINITNVIFLLINDLENFSHI